MKAIGRPGRLNEAWKTRESSGMANKTWGGQVRLVKPERAIGGSSTMPEGG